MADEMILDGAVVTTRFVINEAEDAEPAPSYAIPLERWLALHAAGGDLSQSGVILRGESDPEPLKALLDQLGFVAIHFPKFADGRGYSHARRFRALWGYTGPIIAFGDVLRDQLHYMQRSGFNGFLLRPDQDPKACLAAFSLFTEPYQYGT